MAPRRSFLNLQEDVFHYIHNQEVTQKFRRSDQDFIRSSPLTFPVVVSSILHLFKESVEFNLHKVLPQLKTRIVTGSAFTQARYKIRSCFFKELVNKTIQCHTQSNKKLWKGHRLIAGDGSTLNLPVTQDIINTYDVYSTSDLGARTCLGRVFFLYDILNDFIVHGELSNMKIGEKSLMIKSLPHISEKDDILILDRGFGHFCTVAQLMEHSKTFCVRISKDSKFAREMLGRKINDMIVNWRASKKERENACKNKLSVDTISIRIIKIKLKTGEIELLATNLMDSIKYSREEICHLYKQRWGVEEGFKKFKPKMKIEQFGCRKAEGILQEFYAHIFCFNMISLVGNIASILVQENTQHRKRFYKYNWQNAYRFLREKMIQMISVINHIYHTDTLIHQIVHSLIPIIPDRTFIRNLRYKKQQRRMNQCFK